MHTTFLLCQLVLEGQSIRLGRKKGVVPSCLLPLALFVFSIMSPQQGFSTLQQHCLSLVAAEYSWQFFQLHRRSAPPLPPLESCVSSNVQFHLHVAPLPGFQILLVPTFSSYSPSPKNGSCFCQFLLP